MFRFAEGEISWTRSLGRPQRDRIAAEIKRSRAVELSERNLFCSSVGEPSKNSFTFLAE